MITNADWRVIEEFVAKQITRVGEPFVQATVIAVNVANKTIFCKEFGDTPIPIIAFDYQVKYSYKEPSGTVTIKKTRVGSDEVDVVTPKVGEIVLIAQHFGSRRLPKCLGVIRSKKYIDVESD